MTTKKVLNVGAGGKGTKIPPWFDGWEVVRLDIDPKVSPDLLMDARDLESLDGELFDAVHCSHNLEHYSPHDGAPPVPTGKFIWCNCGVTSWLTSHT